MSDTVLPCGWAEAPLEALVEVFDHFRVPIKSSERDARGGGYPYYGANGLAGYIDDYIFEGAHVLLAEDGGFFDQPGRGVAYEVEGRFWVNNHAHVLRPLGGIPMRYLVHLLNTVDWMPLVTGTTRFKLTQQAMRSATVRIPPLNEQRRIVAKIEALFARTKKAREALETIPPLLEKFRQSVLAAAFRGDLTAEWRAKSRVVGESRQVVEVGDPYRHCVVAPDHWKEHRLADVCNLVGGSQPPKATFAYEPTEGYVRLVQIRDYKTDAFATYVPSDLARRFCNADDVMIGRYGPPIFQILRGIEGAYNVALMKAEPIEGRVTKSYLYYFLQNPLIQGYVMAGSDRTAGQDGVNKRHLEDYPVFLPTLDEQDEIVRLVEAALDRIAGISAQVEEGAKGVASLEQSILAKAFRGELVPQDPSDEPASVLLERIRAERAAAGPAKRTRGRAASSDSSGDQPKKRGRPRKAAESAADNELREEGLDDIAQQLAALEQKQALLEAALRAKR